MPTIAIVGAGRGLGAAVAHEFAGHGYNIALISRSQEHVDALAEAAKTTRSDARGFVADVRDPEQLTAALARAANTLGPIEILQYSPVPPSDFMKSVLATTSDDLVGPVEQSIYGPVTAVQQVLPGMRNLGRGTVLFVNGGSAVRPSASYAGTSVAFAAQSAYGNMLHAELANENIHVSQLIIPGAIDAADAANHPDSIARTLWDIHNHRGEYRRFTKPLD